MKDTVTFWIAVAGFAMSLLSWIYNIFASRRNIEIRVISWRSVMRSTMFRVQILNKSRLPISITKIDLLKDQQPFSCVLIPKKVLEKRHTVNGAVVQQQEIFSIEFPISISALGATQGFVLFEGNECMLKTETTTVTVLVHTNRGKPIRTKLELPAEDPESRKLKLQSPV